MDMNKKRKILWREPQKALEVAEQKETQNQKLLEQLENLQAKTSILEQ